MNPEELRAHRQKLAMRARKLSDMGRPQRCLPHEYEEALGILKRAHASGMSMEQIGYQLELTKSGIGKILAGGTKTIHRETYDKIIQLQPELPEKTGDTRRGGARTDPTTITRRLQALAASGWSSRNLQPILHIDQRNLSNLLLGKVGFVYAITAKEIAEAYEKIQYMDPTERCTPLSVTRTKARALRMGWAPTWAWDSDTLDDPNAQPEWTGACGSAEGYRIHIRETIFEDNWLPLCDRCRAVVESRPPDWTPTVVLKRDNMIEALKASPKPVKAIAREVLGEGNNARDTLYRWRDGSRNPRNVGIVQRLADALDVPIAHLLDEEAMEAEASAPAVGGGEFNPYVLRAAMEMGGMSQHKMAMVPGSQASAGAIGKWLKGEMKPSDKSKVKPIAKYFGVDVEVFFQ